MTTPMTTEPAGRFGTIEPPEVGTESTHLVKGQVDVAERARVDGRRADRGEGRRRNWWWPG